MNDFPVPDESSVPISEVASKGGAARAKSLTPERRSEIAKAAVEARWKRAGKSPGVAKATHSGRLKIGDLEMDCAVLEDGQRVLSQRSILGVLGMNTGGKQSVSRRSGDGVLLPLFLSQSVLKPFISSELMLVYSEPVQYQAARTGAIAIGLKADLIPSVCDVWLKARDAGALKRTSHLAVAERAYILMRGLAHVAIIALVDEATGYQAERERNALAKILEAFVAKELRPWVHTFPAEYYRELYRLRGLAYPPKRNRMPQYFGTLTNDLVYRRLAPGVLDELRRVTPRDDKGRLKSHLHRHLTDNVGHPKLLQHLGAVVAAMKFSENSDYEGFVKLLDKHYPRQVPAPLFDKPVPTLRGVALQPPK